MNESETNISIDGSSDSEERLHPKQPSPLGQSSALERLDQETSTNKRKAADSSPSFVLHPSTQDTKDFGRASSKECFNFPETHHEYTTPVPSSGREETTYYQTGMEGGEVPSKAVSSRGLRPTIAPCEEPKLLQRPEKLPTKAALVGLPKKRQRYQRRNSFLVRRDSSQMFASAASIMDDINRACFGELSFDDDDDNKGGSTTRETQQGTTNSRGHQRSSSLMEVARLGDHSSLPMVPSLANGQDETAEKDNYQQYSGGTGRSYDDSFSKMNRWGHASWANTADTNWYSDFSSLSFYSAPTIAVPAQKQLPVTGPGNNFGDSLMTSTREEQSQDAGVPKNKSSMPPPPAPPSSDPSLAMEIAPTEIAPRSADDSTSKSTAGEEEQEDGNEELAQKPPPASCMQGVEMSPKTPRLLPSSYKKKDDRGDFII